MLEIFDNEFFHMGGDEVKLDCWEEEPEITAYLLNQGKNNTKETLVGLWGEFQEKGTVLKLRSSWLTRKLLHKYSRVIINELFLAYNLLLDARQNKEENVTAVMWTSELASIEHVTEYLPANKYAIQIWTTGHFSNHFHNESWNSS